MTINNSYIVLIVCIVYFGNYSEGAGSCGLQGLDTDTPNKLPPIPDNLPNNALAWENPTFGNIIRISVDPDSHSPYLAARFSAPSKRYWMNANARTQNFVKERNTRSMQRRITLGCHDETSSRYYLEIPVQDIIPPEFAQEEYIFNITTDWPNDRPISDGQFVIVNDNAVELNDNPTWLRFVASQEIIEVEPYPMWVLPYPAKYYFRLDIYLKEGVELRAGEVFQISLSALDDFNTGATIFTIRVSEN